MSDLTDHIITESTQLDVPESCKGTTNVMKVLVPAMGSDTTCHIVTTGSAQKTLQPTTSDLHKASADTANLTSVVTIGSNAPGVTCSISISNITDSHETPSILCNTSVPVSVIPSPDEASDTSTISNSTSTSVPEATQVPNESDAKPNAAPSTPVTHAAADLFIGEDDGPDGGFFSGYPSGPATRKGSLITHAKCPALHLMQGPAHLGSDHEPFDLQLHVFPDKPEIHTTSARLCAAEEGCLPTMESEADSAWQTGPHSLHGACLSLTLGPGGPHIAYNVPHPLHATQFNHLLQQHTFADQLPGPGIPLWQMPGVPYDYNTVMHGGWYNHPAVPYPPPYPPPGCPSYRSYMEDYYFGRGGYEDSHFCHDPAPIGQTGTVPEVAVGATPLPPRPGDTTKSESAAE
ncbi:hypothetical protein F5J12DRAFT_897615 [Pisolithus orientalis]|uniref:uncharacterized protein n=1 Tax=Pisolithus orientalis TaxID=936130 RepID=UPI0022241753|nr:uncharacterized protein F5J12DRAFT_897615 [Pisolithus orientalis]KAI5990820.1 hypothetical protein F5J12DRAFT_897615 [Pisolithus orientalis]